MVRSGTKKSLSEFTKFDIVKFSNDSVMKFRKFMVTRHALLSAYEKRLNFTATASLRAQCIGYGYANRREELCSLIFFMPSQFCRKIRRLPYAIRYVQTRVQAHRSSIHSFDCTMHHETCVHYSIEFLLSHLADKSGIGLLLNKTFMRTHVY